jgi:hypothetical protein
MKSQQSTFSAAKSHSTDSLAAMVKATVQLLTIGKMKSIFLLFFVLIHSLCFSQADNYQFPKIVQTGKSLTDFVPLNWKIRDTISCDFNKDSLKDWAIVIETIKPLVFEDTTCFSSEPFYPKMLIVIFKQSDETFQLSTFATKLFGNCNWGVQGLDPFDKIFVRRNTLGITFLTGGTLRNYISYFFRFQNNDWYLIGVDSLQYWAGHTDGPDAFAYEDINLITGVKETYNTDQHGKRKNYKKTLLEHKPLIKLSELDDNTSIPVDDE